MGRSAVDAGDKAVRFINNLTHTKGDFAGQPFNMRPWQESIIRPLFGTLKPNGKRQYRECYVEIPRKNGKSELAAAIALLMLMGDGEAGAEVYSAAVDRDQASLVFNVAAQMVRNDPRLDARLQIIDSRRRIVDPVTGSFYTAIPAEAAGRHGYNASAIIYDEIHAAPNRDLYDVLKTSMGTRSQPLVFVITTAGWDRNSICWELHDLAEKVRDGIIKDPSFLPVLYAAPGEADWTDEAVWRACNPALDDFRSLEEMQIACNRAKEVPGQQNTFRRLYLCQWTEQADRWLDMGTWDEGAEYVEYDGQECFAGFDLASTRDITAFIIEFQDGADTVWHPTFWIPEDTVHERVRRDRVPYDVWAQQGFVKLTPGNVADYDQIRRDINELGERYNIREIAIDRWNSTQIQTQLDGDGFKIEPFGQGFASMTSPTKDAERLVVDRKLKHGGNPVLRWMASNVAVKQDPAGNLKPDKEKSTEKIDGIVAGIMAHGLAMVTPAETESTVMFV